MLAGEAVIATWNGITPEGRDEFYAWHIQEHIPERVGIPGFRRGRRYLAVTPEAIRDVAAAVFRPENRVVLTYLPEGTTADDVTLPAEAVEQADEEEVAA